MVHSISEDRIVSYRIYSCRGSYRIYSYWKVFLSTSIRLEMLLFVRSPLALSGRVRFICKYYIQGKRTEHGIRVGGPDCDRNRHSHKRSPISLAWCNLLTATRTFTLHGNANVPYKVGGVRVAVQSDCQKHYVYVRNYIFKVAWFEPLSLFLRGTQKKL